MKLVNRNRISIVLGALLLTVATGCGKKESSNESNDTAGVNGGKAGVQESDSEQLALAGTLAIEGLSLQAAEDYGILAYNLIGSTVEGSPQELELDDKLGFTHTVNRSADTEALLQSIVDSQTIAEDQFASLASLFNESEDAVRAYYASNSGQLISMCEEKLEEIKIAGSATLLIAYTKSGDKVEEANSFRFIGLPAGDENMSLFPISKMIGDLNMGEISLSSDVDEAPSEVTAEIAFNLEANALALIAKADNVLKSIKNNYMNSDWKAEPFFLFSRSVSALTSLESELSTPFNKDDYSGAGFYVGSKADTPFVFADLCGESSSRKIVKFTPPSPVTITDHTGTATVNYLSNDGTVSEESQDDKRVCQGDQGFYAREDDTRQFMLNFAAGGALQGDIQAGLWTLSYDGTDIGWFELATAAPFDADGHPMVFMPSIKLVADGSNYTGMVVEFYVYNSEAGELTKVSDLAQARLMMSEIAPGFTLDGGTETAFSDDHEQEMTWSDTQLVMTLAEPVAKAQVDNVYVSYRIGSSTYRSEFRPNSN